MQRIDWNLLAIACAEGKYLSPAQLQKILFLLQKNYHTVLGSTYQFEAYYYGPFSVEVYKDAEKLEEMGLVHISRTLGGWKMFAATPQGLERARELSKTANPKGLEYLRKVVAWALNLSFQDLVRAVYDAYPEMKANSIFQAS